MLFNKFGSDVPATAPAVFVSSPLPGATEMMTMFVTPPAGRFPTLIFVVPPPGSTSTTTTFVATDGPAFVTLMRFVYVAPATTVGGAMFVTWRSADAVTVVITGGVTLFVSTGSGVLLVTLAKFVSMPDTGGVTIRV